MKFTERLKELRTEKRFTQRELAKILGLSANCICEWEKGRSEPSIESLKVLATCLECTTDYLLGFSDDFGNVVIERDVFGERVTTEEKELLRALRALPVDLQKRARAYVEKLKELTDLEKIKNG